MADTTYLRLAHNASLAVLQAAFGRCPPRPAKLHEVLEPPAAAAIATSLAAATGWRRRYLLEDFFGAVTEVGTDAFARATASRRFATFDQLPLDEAATMDALAELLATLADPQLVDAFRALGIRGVATPRLKVIRYSPGDFFGPHFDGEGGLGVLVYLTTPTWSGGNGGVFVYEDETGAHHELSPEYNTAVVFPYRARTTHWVTPVATGAGLRYTIAADYADMP